MKKLLRFEIKQNLRRPTRIYVKSSDLKTCYGYFHSDNPSSFDGWSLLSKEQATELSLFVHNIEAINVLLGSNSSNKLMDFRFRLPIDFVKTVHELTSLFNHQGIKYNFFEAALNGIIQQMKMATAQLDDEEKQDALSLMDKIGLATYKKLDLSSPIQAVFSELLAIHNKSEKLHKKALILFDKDKSYSPNAIESMASGESQPAKWLVSCAIDILIEERLNILEKCLNENELFLLWAKPLLDNKFNRELLLNKIHDIGWRSMERSVSSYHPKNL